MNRRRDSHILWLHLHNLTKPETLTNIFILFAHYIANKYFRSLCDQWIENTKYSQVYFFYFLINISHKWHTITLHWKWILASELLWTIFSVYKWLDFHVIARIIISANTYTPLQIPLHDVYFENYNYVTNHKFELTSTQPGTTVISMR